MRVAPLLILAALLSACTVKTASDYDQYLRNNTGISYPAVPVEACYALTERTLTHKKEVRTWMGGIANAWIVQFGPMLQSTMQSADVRRSFSSLREAGGDAACPWTITYDLLLYDFVHNRAKLRLTATVAGPDGRFMSKSYYAEGPAQLGKMYWGGGFAVKNAVQQSTKHALDAVLSQQFGDMAAFAEQR